MESRTGSGLLAIKQIATASILGAFMVSLAPAAPLPAQDAQSEEQIDAAADQAVKRIRSPFCPGLMLEVCPTPDAADLRDTISAWAQTGVSADSLVSLVVAQYGEEYRGFPQTQGKGLLAWLMPPLALLLGIGAVSVALKRLRAKEPTDPRPVSTAEADEVRAALEEMERAEGTLF